MRILYPQHWAYKEVAELMACLREQGYSPALKGLGNERVVIILN